MFSARSAWALGVVGALFASCARPRASWVPLGGSHETVSAPLRASASASEPESDAEVVAVDSGGEENAATSKGATQDLVGATPESPVNVARSATPAFQIKPYFVGQIWTRVYDLEFDLKVGPDGGIDVKMVSHQEARFEVLSTSGGGIDKLGIEYAVFTSKLSSMGVTQDSPEELAGKRYVITFSRGKPEVREAGGATPPRKQVDSVKDDAREPFEIEKALRELLQIAPRGRGDFSLEGSRALAGGEDEDTKVPLARASLSHVGSNARGENTALIDLGYTLTNAIDDTTSVEVRVAGNLTVADGPARYQTSTLQGPMELRSTDAAATQGRGSIKITTSYKY